MVALRILIAIFLVSVTVWLIVRFAPLVGNFLGNILSEIFENNSKEDQKE